MSGGCPRVGNFSDQKWGVSVIAVKRSAVAIRRFAFEIEVRVEGPRLDAEDPPLLALTDTREQEDLCGALSTHGGPARAGRSPPEPCYSSDTKYKYIA